ncbi:MFS transporter, partial [Streptomyces albidoflavus]
ARLGAGAAGSVPAAMAAADSGAARERVTDSFSTGLSTSQFVGAAAVLTGGLLAAYLLSRAERAAGPEPVPAGKSEEGASRVA